MELDINFDTKIQKDLENVTRTLELSHLIQSLKQKVGKRMTEFTRRKENQKNDIEKAKQSNKNQEKNLADLNKNISQLENEIKNEEQVIKTLEKEQITRSEILQQNELEINQLTENMTKINNDVNANRKIYSELAQEEQKRHAEIQPPHVHIPIFMGPRFGPHPSFHFVFFLFLFTTKKIAF